MKVNFTKQPGGLLSPASDYDDERLKWLKTGETYELEIKKCRNPRFHGKMFAFFQFCFSYWKSDREFVSETKQFDFFRKELTKLAGFYDEYYGVDGSVRLEAKSLQYGRMDDEEFRECYLAVTQAAMTHIFPNEPIDGPMYARLLSFF